MATYVPAKVSTQFVFFVSLVSQANTKLMQVNPTIAAGDFKVSIDGGALANLGTLPTVTPAAGSMVKITLSTTEMAGANATVVCSDAAGAEWCDLTINIPTAARQVDDLAYPATSGRSLVVDAAGLADANAVKVGPTGSGTAQTAGDLKASITTVGNFVDTEVADIQSRLPAALVAGRIDASVGAMAANVLTATAINADAITAAKVAADVTAEITAGLATTANIGAGGAALTSIPWNAAWDAEVQSEVADELDVIIPDIIPADGTRPTTRQAVYMAIQFLLERSTAGTTVTIKKVDGATTLMTCTINDALIPTSITRAT